MNITRKSILGVGQGTSLVNTDWLRPHTPYKKISAIELFKVYPKLKQFYARCGVLWSRGYFVSTVGHISEATVIKYIEEQKNND